MLIKRMSWLPALLASLWLTNTPAEAQLVETITVPNLGHTFVSLQAGEPVYVRDYLVSHTPNTGGGAETTPFSVELDALTSIAITIQAEAGKRFSVNVPAGQEARLFFRMYFGDAPSTPGITPAMSFQFHNLTGAAPGINNTSFISDNNQTIGFSGSSVPFYSSIAFTGLTITLDYPARSGGPGTLTYNPDAADNKVSFRFTTDSPTDPGPFVSLVDIPESGSYAFIFGALAFGQGIILTRRKTKSSALS
jgi:hypothetical protein